MTMGVRDYEYYEARAKDVKLEDITSDKWNASVLASLRDNDPTFTAMFIDDEDNESDFSINQGDDLGFLGYFLGRSKHMKRLNIFFTGNQKIEALFGGLGHNRSIEDLNITLSLGESFHQLIPFLRNNDSLRNLTFHGSDIGLQCARDIALLLGQQSSLKCLNFEETNLGDEKLVEIAPALRKQPQLEELNLSCHNIGKDGCVALGRALGWGSPNLAILELDDNAIDDEGLCALVAGLKNCHNLTSLSLSANGGITESGLRSLSSLFQSEHCRLEYLDLDQMQIDDDGVAVLSTGLTSLISLKKLNLSRNRIGDLGLAGDLLNCCNIEELDLSSNMLSVTALRYLGTLVQRATRLESLNLSSNAIDDDGLQCLVDGMTQHCSLTMLYLSNNSITVVGLGSLARLFRSDCCCLKQLYLFRVEIGDEGAFALADGLKGNTSLQYLGFSAIGSSITARGWAAFSKLLCDTSSVNNTYLSNHTLTSMLGVRAGVRVFSPDVLEYLRMNRAPHQFTAIRKILRSHADIDMEPLFRWKLKCLPFVVGWLEMIMTYSVEVSFEESTESIECRQLSAMYKFVRGMPQLTVNGYRGEKISDIEVKSKKRKFDQTLTL